MERTLHELLDLGDDKDKILPFINDYRLNLFDYHEYEEFKQFRTELQAVFEFLRYAEDKEKLYGRIQKNRGMYESLSSGAKALLVRLTKIKEIPGITKKEVKEGKFEMCKAFEDMRLEGIREGERRAEEKMRKAVENMRFEGVKEGEQTALTAAIENLMNKLKMTAEQAMNILSIPENEQAKYIMLIK